MIKIIYTVAPEQKEEEIDWLKLQRVYPSMNDYYDWGRGKLFIQFGVIVSPEVAMAIKLRHKLDLQASYRQR